MLGKSISINSLILTLFALVTAGLLATIYSATAERIEEQQKIAAEKALLEIIPEHRHDNSMLESVWSIPQDQLAFLGLKAPRDIHVAKLNGQPVAFIVPAIAPDGYSGDIHMLVGVNVDGTVAGVRVLSHKETPGLGDKVDIKKSDWIFSFNGRSLLNPKPERWRVKKDGGEFDQFTGATITPRAVVNQVKNVLNFFAAQRDKLVQENSVLASNESN